MRKQTIEEIYRINSMSRVKGLSVTNDSDGNTYVLGQFFMNMFAGNIYQEATESAIFLAQISPKGIWNWSNIIHEYSGPNNFTVSCEVIYHKGFLYSAIVVGNTGLVIKTNRGGSIQYSKTFTGGTLEPIIRISVDKEGNAYIANSFTNSLVLDQTHHLISQTKNGYVAKISPSGVVLWVSSIESDNSDQTNLAGNQQGNNNVLNDIVTFRDGISYVVGRFTGTITVGNMIIEGKIGNPMDFLLAEIDTCGNWTRVKAFPNGEGTGIDGDKEGNLYVVGGFLNRFKLGGSVIESSGINLFVAKLDSDLMVDWVVSTKYDTDIANHLVNIVVDRDNNSYINGFFNRPISFGNKILTPPETIGIDLNNQGGIQMKSDCNSCNQGGFMTSEFVAKLSARGSWKWSYQIDGSDSTANSKNISVNSEQHVWVTGGFSEKLSVLDNVEFTPKTALFLIKS